MKNPTLHDVAALAGVSYATADRVVNRRGNVAEKSVRKVNDAVAQLGYVRNIAAAKLSKSRHHHLAFVLPDKSHDFFGRMHDQLAAAALHLKTAGVVLDVIEFEAFDARALEQALSGLIGKSYDGAAFVGQGLDKFSTSLTALRAEGTKIVTLVSDVPENNRDHYIGIDNVKAGRTAGRLIGFSHGGKPGHVVLTAGSLDLRDHSDRINGFREVIEADFPNIGISEVIETKDQAELMQQSLHQNLSDASPVTAIYNAGAGNEGLVRALRERDPDGAIFCIVHELSTTVCDALQDGFVDVALDQRPEIEMNRALALLQAIADEMPPPPSPELIPAIYVRDNLPTEMN